jgi:hypothetical protein
MKKIKIFSVVALSAFLFVNIFSFQIQPAKADWMCYGYHWKICTNGKKVIRCDCDNTPPECYASWQDLCDDPE